MVVNKISRLFFARTQSFLQIAMPLLFISILFILINRYDPAFLNSIIEKLTQHPIEYCLFRWGILCFFVLCWPYIVLKIGQRWGATPEQILHWRKEAWRLGVWLIIIELLVCENLVSKIIHLLKGL
jgi:hypothetical protein